MFLVVAMSGTALATTVVLEVDDVVERVPRRRAASQVDIPEITEAEAGGARTILLLGSDARYEDKKLGAEAALGHDPARPRRPRPRRDRRHVDPARPRGRRSRATAATRSTPPSRTAASG